MGWDEKVFKVALRVVKRVFNPPKPLSKEELNKVTLLEVTERLRIFAAALSGEHFQIKEAEAAGGVSGRTLLLPSFIAISTDRELNGLAYLYRVAFSVTSQRLGLYVEPNFSEELKNQKTIQAIPLIEKKMFEDLPGLVALKERLVLDAQKVPFELYGLLPLKEEDNKKILSDAQGAAPKGSLSSGTERKGKPKEKVEEVKEQDDKLGDNPLVHSFEKLHTADEYKGGQKTLDGSDQLEEHLDALEELDLRKIIRTRERTQSLYRADVVMESSVGELGSTEEQILSTCTYDEWDEKQGQYKKDWCNVFVIGSDRTDSYETEDEWILKTKQKYARQIRELRQEFERLRLERKWRNRQLDGSETDIDAIVDRYAALKSGNTPDERLYLSRRRHERDIATLLLIDSSLSTDSWVQNRRVLDIAKESVFVLGEVIEDFHDKIAVNAFYSNTRKDCRYIEIKNFEQSWSDGQCRLAGLKPAGYTRIGAALRHSVALLSKIPAKKKLLLLISDGKPTDYDRYEGRYGVADVRQAIREGNKLNVLTRALAIDAEAKFWLPQMFGVGNYQILAQPEILPRALAKLYSELLR